MKHHIFLVVFSFLFTGLCTAQAQKSWWQLAYEEEQSISALFDENKFDQAEKACRKTRAKYKNYPANAQRYFYLNEHFRIDNKDNNDMRAIKLLKGLMQDAQYEKYQHQCSSEIASAIDECKKFRSIIEFGTNAIAKLIIETLK